MKSLFLFAFEAVKIFVIAAAIVVPVHYFLFQPYLVKGESMEPNFKNGDYLIVDEISYRFKEPERGEVIVFKYPNDPSQRYIKRIIGLPGEEIKIENNKVMIDGKILDESGYIPTFEITGSGTEMTLKNNEYFVMGDNRSASFDSRRWGTLPSGNIIGRVAFRAWPFAALMRMQIPLYNLKP